MQVGDVICVIFGAKVPYVLRSRNEGGVVLVGEAYCDGIMDGKFIEQEPAAENFVIF